MKGADVFRERYAQVRKRTGLSQAKWACLFNLGKPGAQHHVSEKEHGKRGITKTDMLTLALIEKLLDKGVDFTNAFFNDEFELVFASGRKE